MSHNLWHITLKVVTSWFWILVTELRYWWQVCHQHLWLQNFVSNTRHQHRWTPIWVNLHNLVYCIWNMMSKILKFNIRLWSQRGPLCTFELDEHICGDSLWDPIVGSLSSMLFSRFSSSWPFDLGYRIAMKYV